MKNRSRLNIQREDARLKRSATELVRTARKFAPKWNRLSGRMAIERSTARSLRAATGRVTRTNKKTGQILEWLDRVRKAESVR
jgi:hypothetical protein